MDELKLTAQTKITGAYVMFMMKTKPKHVARMMKTFKDKDKVIQIMRAEVEMEQVCEECQTRKVRSHLLDKLWPVAKELINYEAAFNILEGVEL